MFQPVRSPTLASSVDRLCKRDDSSCLDRAAGLVCRHDPVRRRRPGPVQTADLARSDPSRAAQARRNDRVRPGCATESRCLAARRPRQASGRGDGPRRMLDDKHRRPQPDELDRRRSAPQRDRGVEYRLSRGRSARRRLSRDLPRCRRSGGCVDGACGGIPPRHQTDRRGRAFGGRAPRFMAGGALAHR